MMLDPFRFISKRCRRSILLTGANVAELFYNENRFMRQGAAPMRLQHTLFGKGSVQMLDDQVHGHRKHMFMMLMSPEGIARLKELTAVEWQRSVRHWDKMDKVVLYRELQPLLNNKDITFS